MKDLADRLIRLFPAYFDDLIGLVTGPKRFLARRVTETNSLELALRFLALSFAINYILKLPFLRGDVWLELGASVVFVFLEWFLIGTGIWLAWRILGGTASLRDTFVIWFYVAGIIHYIQSFAFLLALGTLRAMAPSIYEEMMAAVYSGQFLRLALDPNGVLQQPEVRIALALGNAGILAAVVWLLAGWGAFRSIHGRSRSTSAFAFIIAALFCLPIWLAFGLLANALVR
jgi:hypothetical protein